MPETRLGQGSDVVLGMIEKCDLTKGSTVADIGMYGVGTIQENRLQEPPLKIKAALQKETRGIFDNTYDGNNLLVAWRDNKVVIHRCHQLFVTKFSFVNKALVES